MFTFVIIVVVAAVVYLVYISRKPSAKDGGDSNPFLSTDLGARSSHTVNLDPNVLPPAWEMVRGAHLGLKLSDSVTVTLQGPISAAQEVESYLVRSRGKSFPDRAPGLAVLMSRLNVEVPEIEEFRKSVLAKVQRAAVAAVSKNRDIAKLRAEDPDLLQDLLETAEEEALEALDGRPSMWRTLDELRVSRPTTLEADDALLAKVKHDARLLWVYSGFASDQAKARRVRDEESIEPWVALVDSGLATRGADIPAENLVTAFTLAELNDALKPDKPIRRKAAAVPQLTGPALAALPGIRRTFLVKPLDADTTRAIEGFEWVRTQAALLVETVASAEFSQIAMLKAPQGTRGAHWSVFGECCSRARKLQDQDDVSGRRPRQLPPYHIGCEARVEVWVE